TRFFQVLLQLADNGRQLRSRGAQIARQLVYHRLAFTEALKRVDTGDRTNPSHAGSDRFIAEDLEETNIAGGADVRSSAQFFGENILRALDGKHAHLLAILLAKERHRARAHRFFHRHLVSLDRLVTQDVIVDQV